MDNFNFGQYDPTLENVSPFKDNSYVDTKNEDENRKQFGYPLHELRTYINETIVQNANDTKDRIDNLEESLDSRIDELESKKIDNIIASDGIQVTKSGNIYIIKNTFAGVTKQYVDDQISSLRTSLEQEIFDSVQGLQTFIMDELQKVYQYVDNKTEVKHETLSSGETDVTFSWYYDYPLNRPFDFDIFLPYGVKLSGPPVVTYNPIVPNVTLKLTFGGYTEDIEIGAIRREVSGSSGNNINLHNM